MTNSKRLLHSSTRGISIDASMSISNPKNVPNACVRSSSLRFSTALGEYRPRRAREALRLCTELGCSRGPSRGESSSRPRGAGPSRMLDSDKLDAASESESESDSSA